MYLVITHASGYNEEKDTNKYLIFDSTGENKELLKKMQRCLEWNKIQNQRSKQWRVWLWKRLHENEI